MKICFIAHRINKPITGGEFYNEVLLNGAERANLMVEKWEGIPFDDINNRILRILKTNFIYFVKILKLSKNDILFVDTDFCFRYVLALIWARSVKKVRIIGMLHLYCHLMDRGLISKYLYLFFERFISKRFDYLIVNSRFSLASFSKLSNREIPYTIVEPYSKEKRSLTSKKVAFYPGKLKLLQVGTVEHRKNVLNSMIAASKLKVPFSFDFVGHHYADKYFQRAKSFVATNALQNKIFFRGKADRIELEKYYLQSTIFILVSRLESYGMVYAEAMQYGLPIVGSITGAVPELVIDGENGYLCDPENPEQIADAIMKLTDKDNWERISNNNFKKSAELMDKETFLEKSTELFTKISTWYPSRLTSI